MRRRSFSTITRTGGHRPKDYYRLTPISQFLLFFMCTDLFLAVLFQVGTDTVLRTRFSLLSWLYRLLPLSSLSGITSMALHILSVLVKMNLFHLSSMGQNNQYQNLLLGSLNQPAIQQRKPIIGTISFLLYPSNLSGFCISPLSWCPK